MEILSTLIDLCGDILEDQNRGDNHMQTKRFKMSRSAKIQICTVDFDCDAIAGNLQRRGQKE